jgi:hypothetical protein
METNTIILITIIILIILIILLTLDIITISLLFIITCSILVINKYLFNKTTSKNITGSNENLNQTSLENDLNNILTENLNIITILKFLSPDLKNNNVDYFYNNIDELLDVFYDDKMNNELLPIELKNCLKKYINKHIKELELEINDKIIKASQSKLREIKKNDVKISYFNDKIFNRKNILDNLDKLIQNKSVPILNLSLFQYNNTIDEFKNQLTIFKIDNIEGLNVKFEKIKNLNNMYNMKEGSNDLLLNNELPNDLKQSMTNIYNGLTNTTFIPNNIYSGKYQDDINNQVKKYDELLLEYINNYYLDLKNCINWYNEKEFIIHKNLKYDLIYEFFILFIQNNNKYIDLLEFKKNCGNCFDKVNNQILLLKNELSQYQKLYINSEKNMNIYNTRILKLQNELNDLYNIKEELDNNILGYQDNIANLDDKINVLNLEIQDLQNKILIQKNNINAKKENILDLEDQLDKYINENDSLQKENNKLQSLLNSCNDKQNTLNIQISNIQNEYKNVLSKKNDEINKLKEQQNLSIKELNEKFASEFKIQEDKYIQQLKNKDIEYQTLINNLEIANKAQLEQKDKFLESTINKNTNIIQQENEILKANNSSLNNTINSLNELNLSLLSENDELKKLNQELNDNYKLLKSKQTNIINYLHDNIQLYLNESLNLRNEIDINSNILKQYFETFLNDTASNNIVNNNDEPYSKLIQNILKDNPEIDISTYKKSDNELYNILQNLDKNIKIIFDDIDSIYLSFDTSDHQKITSILNDFIDIFNIANKNNDVNNIIKTQINLVKLQIKLYISFTTLHNLFEISNNYNDDLNNKKYKINNNLLQIIKITDSNDVLYEKLKKNYKYLISKKGEINIEMIDNTNINSLEKLFELYLQLFNQKNIQIGYSEELINAKLLINNINTKYLKEIERLNNIGEKLKLDFGEKLQYYQINNDISIYLNVYIEMLYLSINKFSNLDESTNKIYKLIVNNFIKKYNKDTVEYRFYTKLVNNSDNLLIDDSDSNAEKFESSNKILTCIFEIYNALLTKLSKENIDLNTLNKSLKEEIYTLKEEIIIYKDLEIFNKSIKNEIEIITNYIDIKKNIINKTKNVFREIIETNSNNEFKHIELQKIQEFIKTITKEYELLENELIEKTNLNNDNLNKLNNYTQPIQILNNLLDSYQNEKKYKTINDINNTNDDLKLLLLHINNIIYALNYYENTFKDELININKNIIISQTKEYFPSININDNDNLELFIIDIYKQINEQFISLSNKVNIVQKNNHDLSNELNKIKNELESNNSLLKDSINDLLNENNTLKNKIIDLNKDLKQYDNLQFDYNKLLQDYKLLDSKYTKNIEEINNLNNRLQLSIEDDNLISQFKVKLQQTEDIIKSNNITINELSKKNSNLSLEINNLNNKYNNIIDELNKEKNNLIANINNEILKNKNSLKYKVINHIKIKKLENDKLELLNININLNKELEKLSILNSTITNDIKLKEQEIKILEIYKEDKTKLENELLNNTFVNETNIDKLKELIKSKNKQIIILSFKNNLLNKQIKEINDEKNNIIKQLNESHINDINALTVKNNFLNNELLELQKIIKVKSDEIALSNLENNKLQNIYNDLEKSKLLLQDDYKNQITILNKELKQKELELFNIQNEYPELQSKLENQITVLNNEKNKIEQTLQNDIITLSKKCIDEKIALENTNNENLIKIRNELINEYNNKIQTLNTQLLNLTLEKDNLNIIIENLNSKIYNFEKELLASNSKNLELEQAYLNMKNLKEQLEIKLNNTITEKDSIITELTNKINSNNEILNNNTNTIIDDIETIKQKLTKDLSNDCDEKIKEINDKYNIQISNLENENKNIVLLQKQLENTILNNNDLQNKFDNIQKSYKDQEIKLKQQMIFITFLKLKLSSNLKQLNDSLNSNITLEKNKIQLENDIKLITSELDNIKNQIPLLKEQHINELNKCNNEIININLKLAKCNAKNLLLENKIKNLTKEKIILEQKLDKLNTQLKYNSDNSLPAISDDTFIIYKYPNNININNTTNTLFDKYLQNDIKLI